LFRFPTTVSRFAGLVEIRPSESAQGLSAAPLALPP
jgi:hypothetical protein